MFSSSSFLQICLAKLICRRMTSVINSLLVVIRRIYFFIGDLDFPGDQHHFSIAYILLLMNKLEVP